MPIIDYHCHINPQEIAEDRRYDNITQVWLGGDHYKWRVMRANGVPEAVVTGCQDSDPYRTFSAWAQVLPRCIGNPLYHWTHLELQRYFGVDAPLSARNSEEIYAHCNKRLQDEDMTVRGIIEQSNVKVICTTDDPVDDLRWHKQIAADESCKVKVYPAWRPDKAMNIEKPEFAAYIAQLATVSGQSIDSFASLKTALSLRMDYFDANGCRVSDHGLDYPVCRLASEEELESVFQKGLQGELSRAETEMYKTAFLTFLASEYHRRGWVMQIHYGCIRNISTPMYEKLGPDTGFDAIGHGGEAEALAGFMNECDKGGFLPRMVLYSLNQYDNEIIATIASSFQTDCEAPGRIQLGAGWWFNDTESGMRKQLTDFANLGVLGNFVGMLTDSRSYLSYTRHEYFRRILCDFLGEMVESGRYPADMETLGGLVEDICYNNTARFFNF